VLFCPAGRMSEEDWLDSQVDEPSDSELDELDIVDDLGVSDAPLPYQVVEEHELDGLMKREIEDVKEFLSLPSSAYASALLRAFKWNKERLIQSFIQSPEKTFKICNVTPPKPSKKKKSSSSKKKSSKDKDKEKDGTNSGGESLTKKKKTSSSKKKASSPKTLTCDICFDDFKESKSLTLSCGHQYCHSCWLSYLEMKVREGAGCVYTTCMHHKCNELVKENMMKKFLSPELFQQYQKWVRRSFVEDNPLVKNCPFPGCTNVIKCETARQQLVVCKCGFQFCYVCCDYDVGDHMPASCEQVERWQRKASDESENVNWLMANTKKCPNCRSPIEKNGGCMHMMCLREAGGCGHDFCWLCRGPWSEHNEQTGGYYACNKYKNSRAEKEDDKALDVKTELESYMWYYHRYESHKNAMKVADDQLRNASIKGVELQTKFNIRSQDTKFLTEATEQLLVNRRVLEWSYVYGYYSDKTNVTEKNLFEYLQENLEKYTNSLSDLYEKHIQKIPDYHGFIAWKEDVTNYTRVTKKYLDNFVEGVCGGLVA